MGRSSALTIEETIMRAINESRSSEFPRVQIMPGIGCARFLLDGIERLSYNFGHGFRRPFVFPIIGPSGAVLTRMGHPNPVGHEHHKSLWFGHQKVGGVNFWEEPRNTDTKIRHRRVTLYHDGPEFGGLAADLEWWSQGRTILRQSLIVALEPLDGGDYAIDLQSPFESDGSPVPLGKTQCGFLGLRAAKTRCSQ